MLTRAQAGASGYYIMIPAMVILALVAVIFVVILTNAERRIPSPEGFSLFSSSFLSSDAFTVQTVVNVTVSPACMDHGDL